MKQNRQIELVISIDEKIENFNYLNVAFLSYKLTMWNYAISRGHRHSGQRPRKIDISY